ncbi:transposase, partial [Streptomyces sp. NP160]|uniref:transposase n=2 Tax=Streptomyces sp. NP160 TaxID=2586637 RepID=UPI00111943E5
MAADERHDLKDAEWALLEPLLPDCTPRRGGRWSDHRLIVDAVRWRVRTGCPWRDLPDRFGPWQTVYSRHRRWCADGTWTSDGSCCQRSMSRPVSV